MQRKKLVELELRKQKAQQKLEKAIQTEDSQSGEYYIAKIKHYGLFYFTFYIWTVMNINRKRIFPLHFFFEKN